MKEKTCTGLCGETKPLIEFHKMSRSPDGLQYKCKACVSDDNGLRYRCTKGRHADLMKARDARVRAANRKHICEYLVMHPCVDCDEKDIVVLEFDHLRDKEHSIAAMMLERWEKILEEIAKCEVVCSNCHRRRTANRQDGYYRISFLESAP
jgi:hypothetical protein